MGKVIFCATDFYLNQGGYRSYSDFFNLVRFAGYPIIHVKDIDPQSDNTYIFTPANGETVNGWPNAKAQIILWQLEWMLSDEHNTPPGVRRVWASDYSFAVQHNFEYVLLGSDDRLNEVGSMYPVDKSFDVSFLSYQTGRRQVITREMLNRGIILAPVDGLWGRQRSDALLRSRIMVHVHQHDKVRTIAPSRWAIAAAHVMPLISETVDSRGAFGFSNMMQSEYKYLTDFTKHMLKEENYLRNYAQALHSFLCIEHSFKKVIEANV